MGDLSDTNSALNVKLVGQNTSNVETNPVDATANGLKTEASIAGGSDGTIVGNVSDSLKVRETYIPLPIEHAHPARRTYSYATSFVAGTAPTDVFQIAGAANRIIRITRVSVSSRTSSGSGIATQFNLIKRSTANSGGTSVSGTPAPHDSADSSALATLRHYTANPTLGTAVARIRNDRVNLQPSDVSMKDVTWEFSGRQAQSIVLRGSSELLCVNMDGTTVVGNITDVDVEWTEETI